MIKSNSKIFISEPTNSLSEKLILDRRFLSHNLLGFIYILISEKSLVNLKYFVMSKICDKIVPLSSKLSKTLEVPFSNYYFHWVKQNHALALTTIINQLE